MSAAASIAVVALAPAAVGALASRFTELFEQSLRARAAPTVAQMLREVLIVTAPLLAAAAATSALCAVLQLGRITIVPLESRADRLRSSPAAALRFWSGARGFVLAVFVVTALSWTLVHAAPQVAASAGSASAASGLAASLCLRMAWISALGLLLAGALDFLIVRADWLERLKMTRDEIRRERREGEGDPELRRVHRQLHEDVARQSAIGAVEEARLVVRDSSRRAVALAFDPARDSAPIVVAVGGGSRAQTITRIAAARRIPVVDDATLAGQLSRTAEGEPIPASCYDAVAELLRGSVI